MQQVVLNIENKELEKKLLAEANKKGRKLSRIILEVLEKNFLKKRERKLHYKSLNPLKHMSKIDYQADENENFSGVFPFADVEDSGEYVRKIRQNTWRK